MKQALIIKAMGSTSVFLRKAVVDDEEDVAVRFRLEKDGGK